MAATGTTSPSTIVPRMLNETIGTRFKIVQGTRHGRGGPRHGARRGRGHDAEPRIAAERPARLARREENPFHLAARPGSRIQFPGGSGPRATRRHARGAEHVAAHRRNRRYRSLAGRPPGVPAERIAALRTAFAAMVADAEFRAAAKTRNAHLDPASGEALQEIVAAAMATPTPVVERTRAIVNRDRANGEWLHSPPPFAIRYSPGLGP